MRVHYWQFLVNEEGQPIADAEIYVYLAGSLTPANLYPAETGGTIFTSDSGGDDIITTGSDGFFEFWIGDYDEYLGYSGEQKFKIKWYKTGIASGQIDYINIFVPITEVDETDTSTAKNKVVSNYQAKTWTDHVDLDITNVEDLPHGIDVADETSTDDTLNKVVSNSFVNLWETHRIETFEAGNLVAHGIEAAAAASSDTTMNKLVSDYFYNNVPTSSYGTIVDTSMTPSGGLYYYDITQNTGNQYPAISIYNTGTGYLVQPEDIQILGTTSIRLWFQSQIDAAWTAIG